MLRGLRWNSRCAATDSASRLSEQWGDQVAPALAIPKALAKAGIEIGQVLGGGGLQLTET